MKRLNYSSFVNELISLPDDRCIELFIFRKSIFSPLHYICTVHDAIVLLNFFKDDCTFIYYFT